jgi:hypothetical protein
MLVRFVDSLTRICQRVGIDRLPPVVGADLQRIAIKGLDGETSAGLSSQR